MAERLGNDFPIHGFVDGLKLTLEALKNTQCRSINLVKTDLQKKGVIRREMWFYGTVYKIGGYDNLWGILDPV